MEAAGGVAWLTTECVRCGWILDREWLRRATKVLRADVAALWGRFGIVEGGSVT